jgi:hypothetical protein
VRVVRMRCTSPDDAHPACGDNELVLIRAARVTELPFLHTIDWAAGQMSTIGGPLPVGRTATTLAGSGWRPTKPMSLSPQTRL